MYILWWYHDNPQNLIDTLFFRWHRQLLEEPQSGMICAALGCLDEDSCWSHLEQFVENINGTVCVWASELLYNRYCTCCALICAILFDFHSLYLLQLRSMHVFQIPRGGGQGGANATPPTHPNETMHTLPNLELARSCLQDCDFIYMLPCRSLLACRLCSSLSKEGPLAVQGCQDVEWDRFQAG